jgi:membrane fusion protein, heavy metal efflux system
MVQFIRILSLLALLGGWFGWSTTYAESDHDESEQAHSEEGEHDEGSIEMDAARRAKFGIVTALIDQQSLSDIVLAPGEVVVNTYESSQVTPRISAQIVTRHTRLGDVVKKDQALVTLSSVEMAEAQGNLMITSREWQRVKKLGREVVSERRYVEAQVAYQQAQGKVRAFGMTDGQVNALTKQSDVSKATGKFDLLAPQDGTVIADEFVIGEVIVPGRVLFEVTDEATIWIEANLRPEDASLVTLNTKTRVSRDGQHWHNGEVVQIHHRLDERTRTQSVRIQIDNTDEGLHPGQFVDVELMVGGGTMKLAAPQEAIVLMDGGSTVFKLEGDDIHPQPIEVGETYGEWTVIKTGLTTGDEIVVQGAFLLKSLLLKSQMGEGHGH